jgi:hypothetical protein
MLTVVIFYREVQKMIEEMEKTESQWKNLPTAPRNRILIKKWKDQAQVRILIRTD